MANTQHLGIPKPDTVADVDQEFFRLMEAWDLVDAIIYALQQLVAQKAAADHGHGIDAIEGLAAALADKMNSSQTFSLDDLTDVNGAAAAVVNYVLVKNSGGQWVPSSALAALGIHEHSIGQVQNLSTELQNLVTSIGTKADNTATSAALANRLRFDAIQSLILGQRQQAYQNLGLGWEPIRKVLIPQGSPVLVIEEYNLTAFDRLRITADVKPTVNGAFYLQFGQAAGWEDAVDYFNTGAYWVHEPVGGSAYHLRTNAIVPTWNNQVTPTTGVSFQATMGMCNQPIGNKSGFLQGSYQTAAGQLVHNTIAIAKANSLAPWDRLRLSCGATFWGSCFIEGIRG